MYLKEHLLEALLNAEELIKHHQMLKLLLQILYPFLLSAFTIFYKLSKNVTRKNKKNKKPAVFSRIND
jgi:hypothetical protein